MLISKFAKIIAGFIDALFYVLDAVVKLAPIVSLAVIVGIVVGLIGRRFVPQTESADSHDGLTQQRAIYGTSLLFALLGITIGFFSGNSRTPVIGDVLPAILTFIAALLGYFVNKRTAAIKWKSTMPVGMAALLLSTLSGVLIGSQMRFDKETTEQRDKIAYEQAEKFYVEYCYELAKEKGGSNDGPNDSMGRPIVAFSICELPWPQPWK